LWVPTSRKEMRAFLGVTILMGVKVMPTIRDYWKKLHFLQCLIIPRVFTRDRFESLFRYLHCVNNETLERNPTATGNDKLGKVRWVLTDFVRISRSLYNPEKYITCDEIMVAYRGHYSDIWQYMPVKPTKYGLKFWAAVCNPSRYIYNLIPYLGSNGQPEKGQGERVVRDLT
jgi:hypothetical protein